MKKYIDKFVKGSYKYEVFIKCIFNPDVNWTIKHS